MIREKLIDKIPLDTPLCVYIEPTNHCNFNCSWCPTGQNLQNKTGFMNIGLYNKIINDFKDMNKIKTLALFLFGESLLHKDIFQMIHIAKESDIAETITISTNGSLIDREMAESIVLSGLDRLVFSVYDFYDVRKNAIIVKNVRDEIGSNMRIVFKYFNKKDVTDVSEFCDEVVFESWFNWNGDFTKDTGIHIEPFVNYKAKHCCQPFYVMGITWDGMVLPCCSDYQRRLCIGNVKISSVKSIWNGDKSFIRCNGCNYPSIIDEYSNIDKAEGNDWWMIKE